MSNTLELWAVPPGALVAELANPTLTPDRIDFTPYASLGDELRARWPQSAGQVARLIGTGGGDLEDAAHCVLLVTHTLGQFLGGIDYSSGEGDEFLTEFGGPLLGPDVIAQMLERPIAGLVSSDYPWFGWVGPAELPAALAGAAPDLSALPLDPPEVRDLQSVWDAARQARELGHDLICVYC